MLSFSSLQSIRAKLMAAPDNTFQAVLAQPGTSVADCLNAIIPLLGDTTEAREFVLYARGRNALGDPAVDANALAIVLPSGAWPLERPPRNAFDALNAARVPSWVDITTSMADVAIGLSHEEARDPVKVRMAVAIKLGMYGYESVGRSDIPGSADPTMTTMVDAVYSNLATIQPFWFDANGAVLAEVTDGRSALALREEEQAKLAAAKAEARRAKAEAAREQARTNFLIAKTEAFAKLNADAAALDFRAAVVAGLRQVAFAEVKTVISASEVWLNEQGQGFAALLAPLEGEAAVEMVQQWILTGLSEVLPDWFKFNAESRLVMVRNDPTASKAASRLNRAQLKMHRAMYRFTDDYGAEAVIAVACAVFPGLTLTGPVTVAEKPEQLQVAATAEELAEEAAVPAAPATPAAV
jgi:hypothetical protein